MPPKVPPKRRTLAEALAAVDRMAIGADNTRTPGYRPPPIPTVAPTPERVRLSPRGGLLAQAVRGESLGDTPLGLVNELVNPVRQGVQTREMANAVAAQARKATRTGLLGDALTAGGMGGLTLATALPGWQPEELARRIMTREQYQQAMELTPKWAHPERGWWGAHSGSRKITGHVARQMGLDPVLWRLPEEVDAGWDKLATDVLRTIARDKQGAGEWLYHGFARRPGRDFAKGDVLRLPSTATSGDRSTVSYGVHGVHDPSLAVNGYQLQTTQPSLFRFEPNTRVAPFHVNDYDELNEWGNLYDEAITAGEFDVLGVERGKRGISGAWWDPPVDIYTLRQKKIFDPETRTYRTP